MAYKLCLFFNIFVCVHAIIAQPFVLKIKLCKLWFYSVYAGDKEFSSCALGCFCCFQWQDRVPSRQLQVVCVEVHVVMDLQIAV